MDPFARKIILGMVACGSAFLLMAGALSVVYFHHRPRCGESVVSEATSPDKQWTAAVMERRCGEESPFFVHVNLRPAAEPVRLSYFSGRADEGEGFLAEQESPGIAWELGGGSPTPWEVSASRWRGALGPDRAKTCGTVEDR